MEPETTNETDTITTAAAETVPTPAADTAAPATAQAAPAEDDDILKVQETPYQETDVFAWANNLFQYKEDLKFDLFLINKNGVLYRTQLGGELRKQMEPLFIDNLLEYILTGAEEGMIVREFEDAEAEAKVLQRTRLHKVEKLVQVMHWIQNQEGETELFVEEDHDMKRIKGIMVRCSHPQMPQNFYLFKVLPGGQVLKGEGAWMVKGKQFVPFDMPAAFKIPADNQMLLIDQDLFVFNQAKLDTLFGYNAKKNSIAEKKVAEIEAKFKLSFAEGVDFQSAVKGSKSIINKLQNVEIGDLTQDQLIDHAEEIGIELMVDDDGAIIIMSTKDLSKFVNLLNDDYVESNMTGIRYEIQRKRPLKPVSDDEMQLPVGM